MTATQKSEVAQAERDQSDEARSGAATPNESDRAELSPLRSFLAIIAGVSIHAVLTMLWANSSGRILSPGSTGGLGAHLVVSLLNATIGGLSAARFARVYPFVHSIILGSVIGLLTTLGLDQVRNFPGWFAAGLVIAPIAGAAIGGALVSRSAKMPTDI